MAKVMPAAAAIAITTAAIALPRLLEVLEDGVDFTRVILHGGSPRAGEAPGCKRPMQDRGRPDARTGQIRAEAREKENTDSGSVVE